MPRDSEPFGPAKPTNCQRLEALVPVRLPEEANLIAHLVIVVAHRAVLAARADGDSGWTGTRLG
jgi:hypothetical protein